MNRPAATVVGWWTHPNLDTNQQAGVPLPRVGGYRNGASAGDVTGDGDRRLRVTWRRVAPFPVPTRVS